jgi:ubiquinone/menaquinone biosynthesis C-methylase UbiE
MSFDALASHYRWMEFFLAGNKLQRCRTAFLARVDGARSILILGEGNGRFLAECRQHLPGARITCVDASARMLALAQARLKHRGLSAEGTDFVHADVLEWTPPSRAFDLIVTHFFLDCFRLDQLERIVPNLARAAMPQASWLLADFNFPAAGLVRYRAKLIHALMYVFFRGVANLSARELTAPDEILRAHAFELQERELSEWGLLHTDRWMHKERQVGQRALQKTA